jgi:hypothetical protein
MRKWGLIHTIHYTNRICQKFNFYECIPVNAKGAIVMIAPFVFGCLPFS